MRANFHLSLSLVFLAMRVINSVFLKREKKKEKQTRTNPPWKIGFLIKNDEAFDSPRGAPFFSISKSGKPWRIKTSWKVMAWVAEAKARAHPLLEWIVNGFVGADRLCCCCCCCVVRAPFTPVRSILEVRGGRHGFGGWYAKINRQIRRIGNEEKTVARAFRSITNPDLSSRW